MLDDAALDQLAAVRDAARADVEAYAAAGADAVLCTPGTVDPFNPKSVRSSAGSLFHVPVFTGMELAEVVAAAREHGMGVLAADGYASVTVSELADAAAPGGKQPFLPHDVFAGGFHDRCTPATLIFPDTAAPGTVTAPSGVR